MNLSTNIVIPVMIVVIIMISIAFYFINQGDSDNSKKEVCDDFSLFDPSGSGTITIKIALPENYKSAENLNSVYLLDANYYFTKSGTLDYLMSNKEGMSDITSRLIENKEIPPTVLIGLGYSESQRDRLTQSGLNAFYNFFNDTLIPEIENRCKVSKSPVDRILFGYSGSASFSTFAFMKDVLDNFHTFDKYVSISGVYFQTAHDTIQNITDQQNVEILSGRDFYFGVGSEDDRFLRGNKIFSDIILDKEFKNFNVKYHKYEGLGHYDIAETAYEDALKWIFSL